MKGLKAVIAVFWAAAAAGALHAADDVRYSSDLGAGAIQVTSPAQAPDTAALVDKMNEYRLQLEQINSLEALRRHMDERVRYELHLGGGLMLPADIIPDQPLPLYRLNSAADIRPVYSLGLKVNLGRLKLVQPTRIRAEIGRARRLLALRPFPGSDEALKECDALAEELATDQSLGLFKRWSIGVAVPFLYRTDRGAEFYLYNYGYGYGSSYQTWYNTTPGFGFDNAAFFIGTDLGDAATWQLGYSARNAFYTALSLDISTPVHIAATDFFNMLRGVSGAPYPGRENYNYYNRY